MAGHQKVPGATRGCRALLSLLLGAVGVGLGGGLADGASATVAAGRGTKTPLVVGTCAGPSPYTTIQQAAEAAVNDPRGAKILVCPGTYTESVRLEGQTDIVLKPYPGFDDVGRPVLHGPSDEPYAVETEGSGDFTVRGLEITGPQGGFWLDSTQDARLIDNRIDVVDTAIHARSRSGPDIIGNEIRSGGIGIDVDNTIAYIDQNVITAGRIGVSVWDGSFTLQQTVVRGASVAAVSMVRVNGAQFHRARLNDSAVGITFDSTQEVSIWRTRVKRNRDAGILIDDDSGDNWILETVLADNGIDAVDGSAGRGTGTAGTYNRWESVTCETSNPVGLCTGS